MKFPDDVPTLSDGSVTLRAPSPADARGCYEQCQDPLSQQWTTVPVPYSMTDAEEFVGSILPSGWREDRDWGFVVEALDDAGQPRYAGSISLRPHGNDRAEIAYGSHPWCRGRGVIERACRLLLDWGFEKQGLQTVIWWANKGNWASRKLAWRLGFTFDGTVRQWLPQRGVLLDAWVGELLAGDPREPRSPWYDVPRIHGENVVLRAHRDDDAGRIQEAGSEERMQHWFHHLPSPYTLDDARTYLETRREQLATAEGLSWAVADPTTDELIGNISLFGVRPGRDAEIGYWTHPAARGRGVMTEACGLVLRHAFVPVEDGGLGLRRVRVTAAEGNTASVRVIEANGFRPTGRERDGARLGDGTPLDLLCFDLLVEEWSGLAGRA